MLRNEDERGFKGIWLPKDIWFDNRLNALEKVIFAEIDSLDTEITGCCVSNNYLAEFCQCSASKISGAISKLIKYGYIYVKSFDGRQRILKSSLTKNRSLPTKICKADLQKNETNKIIYNKEKNIIINNNTKKDAEKVLSYLNEKANKHYKTIESNLKFITARLKDYSETDLKAVIDKKVVEWKGTEMEKYLRPETLFNATKFESYLNAPLREYKGDIGQHFESERNYSREELDALLDDINNCDF